MNPDRRQRAARRTAGLWLLVLATGVLTSWILHRQFGNISLHDIRDAVLAQPATRLLAALSLTGLSFTALALYDLSGVAAVAPHRVPAHVALLAGATANAISNTLGFHALTGSVVRFRIYLRYGLTRAEVVRVVALSWLALGLGFLAMLALSEVVRSLALRHSSKSIIVAFGVTVALCVFVAWLQGGRREFRVLGLCQPLPSARSASLQIAIGTVESAAAIGALYVLLPADLTPPFTVFAVGCIAAVAVGIVAHVPGGIGVFEASITAILLGAGRADLLAALLVYRVIYNFLPFLASVTVLGLLGYLGIRDISSKADTG